MFRSVLNSNSMQFSSGEVEGWFSCMWDDKTSSTPEIFPPRFPETPQRFGTDKCLTRLTRSICKIVSSWPTSCLEEFVRMPLLCLLPLPCCFFKVYVPTLFASLLEIFLPLTTSTVPDAANSVKSAATRFAAGTKYLRRDGIVDLLLTCASAPNNIQRCQPMPL